MFRITLLLLLVAVPARAQFMTYFEQIVPTAATRLEQHGLRGPVRRVDDGTIILEFDRRGNVTSRTRVSFIGQAASPKSDTALSVERFEYDARDSVLLEVRSDHFHGTTDSTINRYDDVGRRVERIEWRQVPFQSMDAARRRLEPWAHFRYRYDSSGRLAWAHVARSFPGSSDTSEYTFAYDSTVIDSGALRGWTALTTTVHRMPEGVLRELFDPEGRRRMMLITSRIGAERRTFDTIHFDDQGRMVAGSLAGTTLRMTYDSAGSRTGSEYDEYVSIDDYLARRNGRVVERDRSTYSYDRHGNWVERRTRSQTHMTRADGGYTHEHTATRTISYWEP